MRTGRVYSTNWYTLSSPITQRTNGKARRCRRRENGREKRLRMVVCRRKVWSTAGFEVWLSWVTDGVGPWSSLGFQKVECQRCETGELRGA